MTAENVARARTHQTQLRDLAAPFARGLLSNFLALQSEGAGKAGCALHPRSRVQNCAKNRTRAYRFSGDTPAFPAQWVTAYSVLSPVNGSFATVALRVFSQDLTPAPRCQDHTTSPSASSAFVKGAIRVHRDPSRVDDVGQRPSFGMG